MYTSVVPAIPKAQTSEAENGIGHLLFTVTRALIITSKMDKDRSSYMRIHNHKFARDVNLHTTKTFFVHKPSFVIAGMHRFS